MTYKHKFEVGDDVRIAGGTQEYHIVFVNYTAQNVTLRNPTNKSYQFGIPFAMLESTPLPAPKQSFRVGDRVMLVGDMKGLYDVKGVELELPTGWKYQIENLTGNVGGWYEGKELALYSTKETLESLKEINKGIKETEQLFHLLNQPPPPLDSALAESRKLGKPISVQEALRILLEATQIQLEYVERHPDPEFIAERITANKLLARIHQML